MVLLLPMYLSGQVSFVAQADALEVLEGSYVNVSFTLNNANGQNFRPPEFKGLKKISGPSQSSSMSTVNGRRSSSISYQYTLLATQKGTYTIDPASINANNKQLKTKPIRIKVLKKMKTKGSGGEEVFAKMQVSDSLTVMGHRLYLSYRVYYKIGLNVTDFEFATRESYPGFEAERVNNFNRNGLQREIINGEEYYTKIVAERTLIPTTTGSFEIAPMIINALIPTNRRRSFFSVEYKRIAATTNGLNIEVGELPLKRPPEYSGAVGNYSIRSTISRNKITQDEAITLKLIITGNGIAKDIIAPSFDSTDDLDIYDPKLNNEKEYVTKDGIMHETIYEYLIVPKQEGSYSYQASFVYFDTDSMAFQTLKGANHRFQVSKGSGRRMDDKEAIQQEELTMAAPFEELSLEDKPNIPQQRSILNWFLLIMSIGLMSMYGVKYYMDQQDAIDPEVKKANAAKKVALEKLKVALRYKEKGDTRAFYQEINNAIFGYLQDKIKMPLSDMNKAQVQDVLLSKGYGENIVNPLIEILQKAELSLYAGNADTSAMDQVYDATTRAIVNLEEHPQS